MDRRAHGSRTRVARRTFALFALASAVPLLGGGWFAYSAVGRELESRAHAHVAEWAKSYGLGVFERLVRAEELLLHASARPSDDYLGLARTVYSRLVVVDAAGTHPLIGAAPPPGALDAAERALDASGRTATVTFEPSGTAAATLVLRSHGGGLAIADLRHGYVWGDAEQLPADVSFCVTKPRGTPLFCPEPRLADPAAAAGQRGRVAPSRPGEAALLAASWDLFLRPRFGVGDLRVVAAEPAEIAFAALASFERLFPPTLGLALALALFAGLVQLRRSHAPLGVLVDAMDALSRGRFDARVAIDTDDEYRRLGGALNATATALGRQFHALGVLSEIDRRILLAEAPEAVVELALPSVPALAGCEAAAIVLAGEAEADAPARLYLATPDGRRDERLALGPGELEPVGIAAWRDTAAGDGTLVARLAREWAAYATLPLRTDGRVVGALLLLSTAPRTGALRADSHAAELANRLSVALTNVSDKRALVRQAYMDALTGLPNRELLHDRLGQELARRGGRVALLFIDLDRFKNGNDSLGHGAGDELLRLVAARIRERVREADTVARLGGDEFTVLAPELPGPHQARHVAEQVQAAFATPFPLRGSEYVVSASIGIAIGPDDGRTPEELLRSADTAMYRAKSAGRGGVAFFEESMNRDARRRLELERRLRRALADGEVSVRFQPKVDLRTGRIVGAEALARWYTSVEGEIPPSTFVPIAEDAGLIGVLGGRVLEDACHRLAEWRRAGIDVGHVAVNLSLRQLRQSDFVAGVGRLLAATALPPGTLELEITESTLVENPVETARILHELRALGVRIAIDDFGTGYSSLASLRSLPIDVLKIDRLFVRDVPGGEHAEAIAEAIVAMGRVLGKSIVAEGVETVAQAEFLRRHGCELAQGWLYGHAMTADDFAARARAADAVPDGVAARRA